MKKHEIKTNRKGNKKEVQLFDSCQTPAYALNPLWEYLKPDWIVWESCAGEGMLVREFERRGYKTIGTDLLTGQNFFEYQPDNWNVQITNPPYSLKFDWLERSYQLGKPFGLLLPVEAMGANKAQKLFEKYGIEIILLNKRVNFSMPNLKFGGSGAWFPTAWFTFGLGIGTPLSFGKIYPKDNNQLEFGLALR